MPKMISYQTVPSQTLLLKVKCIPLRINQGQYDRCLTQDHCRNKQGSAHFCEDPTGPSRRIVSIFLDVVLSQIAAPYTRGSFADAEVYADHDFGLAQVFSQGFEIAIDGRAFFEKHGCHRRGSFLCGTRYLDKNFPQPP